MAPADRVDEMRTRCFPGASKLPRFTLSFAVDFDGTLESRSVQGTLAGPALACLNAYLKTWVFPPPDNGRRSWLRYPVDLVPAAGAPPPRSTP